MMGPPVPLKLPANADLPSKASSTPLKDTINVQRAQGEGLKQGENVKRPRPSIHFLGEDFADSSPE